MNKIKQDKKKGWDKNCGIYNCSDGVHLSWWQAMVRTNEWDLWVKHNEKKMLYDVWEVAECGWMSVEHTQDFMKFVRKLK